MGGMCLLPLEGGPSVTLANYMSTRGINSGLYCLFFQVFNSHFFQVTIDDLRPEPSKLSMLCHADSLGILPVQWCLKNGVSLTPPKGLYSGGKSRVRALPGCHGCPCQHGDVDVVNILDVVKIQRVSRLAWHGSLFQLLPLVRGVALGSPRNHCSLPLTA